MSLVRSRVYVLGLTILLLASSLSAQSHSSNRQDQNSGGLPTLTQYFELLEFDNLDIARDLWTPEALERSGRFGITFADIPLKVDCGSPIIRNLDVMRYNLQPPVRRHTPINGGAWSRLDFSRVVGSSSVKYSYFAEKRGDWYWLGYPQDCWGGAWDVVESKYFRVHVHPDVAEYVNQPTLDEADLFIEAMIDTLDISKEMRKQIEEKKIEYFYCASDTVVEEITGHRVKGTMDMASNDVISAVFPHFHEIMHLLINIKLQELPLYTLPIMREGIAVRYGGRWGKKSTALMELGVFLYREKLVELDSVLTMSGFDTETGADIVYPVAGVFNAYLLEELGLEKTLNLYLQMSGRFDDLAQLTSSDIKNIIIGVTGHDDWAALIADFDKYVEEQISKHSFALPGELEKGKTILTAESLVVKEDKHWLGFEFTPPKIDGLNGSNFLFDRNDALVGQQSSLFEEHYGDAQEFSGYRYSVRVDQNEAGLYDYVTNQLIAKYIWGITPSDEYYDAESNRITVRFRKELLGKEKPRQDDFILLPM